MLLTQTTKIIIYACKCACITMSTAYLICAAELSPLTVHYSLFVHIQCRTYAANHAPFSTCSSWSPSWPACVFRPNLSASDFTHVNHFDRPTCGILRALPCGFCGGWVCVALFCFVWIHGCSNAPGQIILAIMMLIGFIALDIVYAAIVINYATHCELLIIMMRGMSSRVLQKTVSLRDVTKVCVHLRVLMLLSYSVEFQFSVPIWRWHLQSEGLVLLKFLCSIGSRLQFQSCSRVLTVLPVSKFACINVR